MYSSEVKELLKGFEITTCAIRNNNEIALIAQDWSYDDPLEPKETRIFVYKPFNKPKEQWGSAGLGTCTAMFVIPSYLPGERWVFVTNVGDIFVVGENGADFEEPISHGKYLFGAVSIKRGSQYFVGPNRKVIQRSQKNATTLLPFLETSVMKESKGFVAIDGFNDQDLYACGGTGDLLHCNGTKWQFVDLKTNRSLRQICCGTDGQVYILAEGRFLFVIQGGSWSEIHFKEYFDQLAGTILWYQDRLLILTETQGYEFVEGKVKSSKIIAKSPLQNYSHIACNEKNIVLTNGEEVVFFDGSQWKIVI